MILLPVQASTASTSISPDILIPTGRQWCRPTTITKPDELRLAACCTDMRVPVGRGAPFAYAGSGIKLSDDSGAGKKC
jgi:hypothetical protein